VDDVRALCSNDPRGLAEGAQSRKRSETAALAFERDRSKTFGFDWHPMRAQPRRHDDLAPGEARGARHGQEMLTEEPIFGDQIEDFSHGTNRQAQPRRRAYARVKEK
jgi:hypothetical protein